MPTNDDTRRDLMLTFGQFITTNRDQLDDETKAVADDLAERLLAMSFPDGGVDLRWGEASESSADGYRSHSVALAQVDATLRGETWDGEPYPDGADLSHVVDQATWVMSGFTGLVDAAGAPKVGPRVH